MGIKYNGRGNGRSVSTALNTTNQAGPGKFPLPEVRFLALMNALEAPFQEVVRRALFDGSELFPRFATAPASTRGHHRGRAGTLLHTIDVAECALLIAGHYGSLVDQQVVLASALLHDVGKCDEYELTAHGPAMSDIGEMVGHKVIGGAIVWSALEPLRKTSMGRALAIMNAIASTVSRSHDLRAPATLEAMIVSKADQLSAAADLFRESLCRSGNNFVGVRHLHLAERPRHPRALTKAPPPPARKQVISARAQRFPC